MSAPLVLSFDLDDTLWPVGPVIAAAESALLSWLREHYPLTLTGHDIESLRALRARVNERFPERSHDLTFLRHRALKDLFGAAGYAEALADDALEVFFGARNRVEFYEDVRPALVEAFTISLALQDHSEATKATAQADVDQRERAYAEGGVAVAERPSADAIFSDDVIQDS